jgi:hypothetical protein
MEEDTSTTLYSGKFNSGGSKEPVGNVKAAIETMEVLKNSKLIFLMLLKQDSVQDGLGW